jgi:uncharacterized membrane protein YfcA
MTGFGLVLLAAFVGALIQGSIGYGLNLVVVPVVAVLQPEALPGAMIVMSIPMTSGSALLERAHIDWKNVSWITLGRIPGVAIGTWIVVSFSADRLAVAIGAFVVIAAIMGVATPPIRITSLSSTLTGVTAGIMGTTSSIGGPPIAMLYQNEKGPVLRATLGAAFTIGTALSLLSLSVAGKIETFHWALGLGLFPAIAMGLYVSRFTHRWLDGGWLRPCVLAFAVLSGMGVLLRGLL